MARLIKPHTNGYASAADLLAADDRPLQELTLAGWTTQGGGKVKIRVRGLTLPQRDKVLLDALKDGKEDEQLLTEGYLLYGIADPVMHLDDVRAFMQKHAGTVKFVARYIQDLTNLDYSIVEAIARSLSASGDGGEEPAEGAATP